MEIRLYSKEDEIKLFNMLREEGDDWECYWGESGKEKYKNALEKCITYVAYEGTDMCGYIRCIDDYSFGIYIYDLLVDKASRGNSIGKKLMERVYDDFPNTTIYVMSDEDEYYKKIGYDKIGSIFQVHS